MQSETAILLIIIIFTGKFIGYEVMKKVAQATAAIQPLPKYPHRYYSISDTQRNEFGISQLQEIKLVRNPSEDNEGDGSRANPLAHNSTLARNGY